MKAAFTAVFRLFVVVVCGWATTHFILWSRADWLASKGTVDSVKRAMRLEPANDNFLAGAVAFGSNSGDSSWVSDEELRRAAKANPLDARLWVALGRRDEFQGNESQAETDLIRAAALDRQFTPAWTLAGYYYRTNQTAKLWPMLQRCLSLDPLGYSPVPLFDLAWSVSNDARKILSLLPRRGPLPIRYLIYLIDTDRVDAAIGSWSQALGAADPANRSDADDLVRFPDYLIRKERIVEAVAAWNRLVEYKFIASGRLNPEAGIAVADPDFRFPRREVAFGWRIADAQGVFASTDSSSMKFEFDGNEPEAVSLLSTVAPVLAAGSYRLIGRLDPSGLRSQRDPGFTLRVLQQSGRTITECPALQPTGEWVTCLTSIPPDIRQVRIELLYKRALGTTRAVGALRVLNVSLRPAS